MACQFVFISFLVFSWSKQGIAREEREGGRGYSFPGESAINPNELSSAMYSGCIFANS